MQQYTQKRRDIWTKMLSVEINRQVIDKVGSSSYSIALLLLGQGYNEVIN